MRHEAIIRICFFIGIFALMAIWELLAPRRKLTTAKKLRWFNNLSIVFVDSFVVRLVVPVLPVSMSLLAKERGWGLLNNVRSPYWLAVVIGWRLALHQASGKFFIDSALKVIWLKRENLERI